MTMQPSGSIVSVGECMVELARGEDGRFQLGFGGDTFNSAVYMARLGAKVAYVTALGDDPYSAGIMALAGSEGVEGHAIVTRPGRTPGLYLIETEAGERSFWYWRERAPARELFEADGAERAIAAVGGAAVVYFSGVTLSLYSPAGLDRFADAIGDAKRAGAQVVMDSNFRPRGWGGDVARARATFERFWRLADVALPTFDDEATLWGDREPADAVERLRALGVAEIALKLGPNGALMADDTGVVAVPCPERVVARDTTAAGDAFNAAYVVARRRGASPHEAALAGHRLAGIVVQYPGAIVPRAATDGLLSA